MGASQIQKTKNPLSNLSPPHPLVSPHFNPTLQPLTPSSGFDKKSNLKGDEATSAKSSLFGKKKGLPSTKEEVDHSDAEEEEEEEPQQYRAGSSRAGRGGVVAAAAVGGVAAGAAGAAASSRRVPPPAASSFEDPGSFGKKKAPVAAAAAKKKPVYDDDSDVSPMNSDLVRGAL